MSYKLIYLARRNPAVGRADWPKTWRSHAKFASQFPGLPAGISFARYCNRIEQPALDGNAVNLPNLSTAHDGASIGVSDSVALLQGGAFTDAQMRLIEQDERRVFDRLTCEFSFYCTEIVVRDGPAGDAVVFQFLARPPELPRVTFRERLSGEHAQLVNRTIEQVGKVTRYTHNFPLHLPPVDFPFEAIIECWYSSVDDAVRSLRDNLFHAVQQDLGAFTDPRRNVTLLTDICMRFPR
jgi:EthD domain